MSHELRTPLNSMIGMLQLIGPDDVKKSCWEMLEVVKTSSTTLLETVNDILDLSKIEAREVRLEYLAFDINHKVENLVHIMRPMASKNGLSIDFIGLESPVYVLGDPLRFIRIVTNLIGNAVRYTEEGSVTVRLTSEQIFSDQVMIHCEVVDTGIGIAQDRMETIFDKFSQADSSTTRKFGGTGLGLTITRELVELMDGIIGVDSKPDQGSTFWFRIPFETIDDLPVESKKVSLIEGGGDISQLALPPQALNVLVAEDHEMNKLFIKRLFQNLGFESYKIVENGRLCIEEIQNGFYDLVLMDCHMPEMNGYDATRYIRLLDDDKRLVPIIAMTANAMPEDAERCLSIGMNAYISKPVDIDLFKKTLAPWVDFDSSEIDDLASPAADKPSPKKGDAKPTKDTALSSFAPPLDLNNLKANAMGDDGFVREMVELFVTQSQEQLSALKALEGDANNIHDWVEASHALKGSAGGIGAEKMRKLCEEAQNLEVFDAEKRAELIAAIGQQYDLATEYLIQEGYYERS